MSDDPRVEAVARALCKQRGEDPNDWACEHPPLWREWVPDARAALAAADEAQEPNK